MANIIITNKCNLKCPYCFADDMITEKQEDQYITYHELQNILRFLDKSKYQEQIGIIGGEPTLHPNFLSIINTISQYSKEHGCNGLIFTNGILLEQWLPYCTEYLHILINCNSPKTQTAEQYQAMCNTVYTAHKLGMIQNDQVRLGCNIYLGLNDYSYFWDDLVAKVKPHIIRCSVVSPGGCYATEWRHQNKKEEYYLALKDRFMEFVRQAKKHNVILALDCSHIPKCFFTEAEQQEILSVSECPSMSFCRPPVDIDKNMHITSCFGTYDIDSKNPLVLTDFTDIEHARKHLFLSKNVKKAESNNYGRCATCKGHQLHECQGGCLGFVEEDICQ